MARIRSVKPEFHSDERLARDLSREQRLFYVGMWNEADDEGRLRANSRKLLGAIYPYEDDLDEGFVEEVLIRLAETDRAVLYEVGGERICQLTKFPKHQRVNKPSPSKLAPPPRKAASALGWLSRNGTGRLPEAYRGEVEVEVEVEVEAEVEQGKGTGNTTPSPTPPEATAEGGETPSADDRARLRQVLAAEPVARLGLNRMRQRDDEGDVLVDLGDRIEAVGYGACISRWRSWAMDRPEGAALLARSLWHIPDLIGDRIAGPITMALVDSMPALQEQAIHRAIEELPSSFDRNAMGLPEIGKPMPDRPRDNDAERENRERQLRHVDALRRLGGGVVR